MAERRVTARLDVDGMSCVACEDRIEKAVRALPGVREVAASASLCEVIVTWDPDFLGLPAIVEAIRGAGYQVRANAGVTADRAAAPVPNAGAAVPPRTRIAAAMSNAGSFTRFLGLVAVMAALYLIIRSTVGLTFLPKVSQSMGYGLVFLVGLLTSLHCIAMCGGIVLSQGIKKKEGELEPEAKSGSGIGVRLRPSLLYNAGRVVSYTVIGGGVGALGTLFSLSTALKGFMPVIAGLFMLFLGVRMLGVIPWVSRLRIRFPGIASDKLIAAAARRGPFVVGLLNGLMPCGPLQTMQVYALGTGSFLAGAASMFVFSLGTVPLLLGFGAASSFLSAKFNRRMLKASGVLVMVLGLVMFSRGLTLFGVALPSVPSGAAVALAQVTGGYQEVKTTMDTGQYQPFVVQSGIPVRWTINVRAEDLNGCNNPILVPQYGIRKQLLPGENLVQFTPYKEGTFAYTCWMGMISSTFRVVRDLAKVAAADLAGPPSRAGSPSATGPSAGASCCATPERFSGGRIPVDVIQIAKPTSEGQAADVTVNDNGFTPAVIVVKKGVKAKIRFVAEKLSSCNYIVNFPEYRGGLDLSTGHVETPYLDVAGDFTFECGMGMLHGYVKAVDDPSKVDLQALKREIGAYRPGSTSN